MLNKIIGLSLVVSFCIVSLFIGLSQTLVNAGYGVSYSLGMMVFVCAFINMYLCTLFWNDHEKIEVIENKA